MDLGSLRALVSTLNFEAHGLPVLITTPAAVTLATRGIWITTATDDMPGGLELRRREVSRILAIPAADASQVPRLSFIEAPLTSSGAILRWQVDGLDRAEIEHSRLRLVAAPLEES